MNWETVKTYVVTNWVPLAVGGVVGLILGGLLF